MLTISRVFEEEAQEYLEVKINAFAEEVKLYGFGPPGYDILENQVKGIKNGYCYKVVDEDKIIGGVGVMDKVEGHYLLGYIFVDMMYQDKGIGTQIMQFLDKEFPQAKKWSLETPYKSYRNHHFYEKMGYVKVGETEPVPELNGFYLFLYERNV